MTDKTCPESVTIANLVRDIQNKRSNATLVWDAPDRRGSRMMTGTVKWSEIENVLGFLRPDTGADAIR